MTLPLIKYSYNLQQSMDLLLQWCTTVCSDAVRRCLSSTLTGRLICHFTGSGNLHFSSRLIQTDWAVSIMSGRVHIQCAGRWRMVWDFERLL